MYSNQKGLWGLEVQFLYLTQSECLAEMDYSNQRGEFMQKLGNLVELMEKLSNQASERTATSNGPGKWTVRVNGSIFWNVLLE